MTVDELAEYCKTHMCKPHKLKGFYECKYCKECTDLRYKYNIDVGLAEAKRIGILKGVKR